VSPRELAFARQARVTEGEVAVTNRRRRDRHGRGLRGVLVPATVQVGGRSVRVPLAQTRGERFDDLVLDAVEHLEQRWGKQLEGVEFAVEDVPAVPADGTDPGYDADVVADETAGGAVPLGRLLPSVVDPSGEATPARVVVYRRPLEARAADRMDLADLVHDVVVDQVARLLGMDPDEIDPPTSG
jgi:predicted Zn-dependent protease with MMP-like domain